MGNAAAAHSSSQELLLTALPLMNSVSRGLTAQGCERRGVQPRLVRFLKVEEMAEMACAVGRAVVAALEAHEESPEIVQLACRCLWCASPPPAQRTLTQPPLQLVHGSCRALTIVLPVCGM